MALFPPWVTDGSVRSVEASGDLAAAATADLTGRNLAGVQWVERTEIRRVLEERNLALGLLEEPPDAPALRLLRADVALVGEFSTNQARIRSLRLRAVDLSTGEVLAERRGDSAQPATGPLRPDSDLVGFLSNECEALLRDTAKVRRERVSALRLAYLFHLRRSKPPFLDKETVAERLFRPSAEGPRVRRVLSGDSGMEFAEAALLAAQDPKTAAWKGSVDRILWTEEIRDQSGAPNVTVHILDPEHGEFSAGMSMGPNPNQKDFLDWIRENAVLPRRGNTPAGRDDAQRLAAGIVEAVRLELEGATGPTSVGARLERLRLLDLALWFDPDSLPALRLVAEQRWPAAQMGRTRDPHRFAVLRAEAWRKVVERRRRLAQEDPGLSTGTEWIRMRDEENLQAFEAVLGETQVIRWGVADMTASGLEARSRPALEHLLAAVELTAASAPLRTPEAAGRWLGAMLELPLPPTLLAAERLAAVERMSTLVPGNWFGVDPEVDAPSVAVWLGRVAEGAADPGRGRRLAERLVSAPRVAESGVPRGVVPVDTAATKTPRSPTQPIRLRLPRHSEVFPTPAEEVRTAPIRIELAGKPVELENVPPIQFGKERGRVVAIAGNGGDVFLLARFQGGPAPSAIEVGGVERVPEVEPSTRLFRGRGKGPLEPVPGFVGKDGGGLILDGEGHLLWTYEALREVDPETGALGPVRNSGDLAPAMPMRLPSGALRMGNQPNSRIVLRGAFSVPDLGPGDFSGLPSGFAQALREGAGDRLQNHWSDLLKGRRRGEFGRVRIAPTPGIQAADATRAYLALPSTGANLVTLDIASGQVVSAVQVPGGVLGLALGPDHLWILTQSNGEGRDTRLLRVARTALERGKAEWRNPEVSVEEWNRIAETLPSRQRDAQLVFGGCERRFLELHRDFDPERADELLLFLMAVAHDPHGLNEPARHRQGIADLRRRFPRSRFASLFPTPRPTPRPDIVDPQ